MVPLYSFHLKSDLIFDFQTYTLQQDVVFPDGVFIKTQRALCRLDCSVKIFHGRAANTPRWDAGDESPLDGKEYETGPSRPEGYQERDEWWNSCVCM